ncbi:RNA polymerase sigma factor [Chryseobacterium caseinilyticum]|uniref:RNA polymerase sigma-70 region 2 domain-containing protein n=1 Tax=Chryseobacterium caseinilyticum TaxID=2771428 RepID=A0ABR8Z8E1_9FLAO|nr:hypothetical protein [Chryseobacterium caseinilyticum]MBD8081510.1 hypothetical protein [Chryseobacterium caseinilyticum]
MASSDNKFNCCTLLRQKDRETFDFLYAEFNSQFYGMALQCLGDEELANEMMILTFTNIWKDLDKFNGDNSQLRSWCISILMRSLRHVNTSDKTSDNSEITEIPQLKSVSV